jgi:sec-independent protein translocase protein TatB
MFDIGFAELLLVGIVGLLVLGPERLPGAVRTASMWLGKLRRSFNSMRAEIEREMQADDIKRELHNNAVLQSLKEAEQDLRKGLDTPYDISDIHTGSKGDKPIDPPSQ